MSQTILITGVLGFIASHVLAFMVNKYKEHKFIGMDKISYCSNEKNIRDILNSENFQFVKADITNLEFMDYIFQTYKIDTVLHFAAYTHVDHSFGNSLDFTRNNVLGTHVLLEVSKKYKIQKFIHVSTDEVYGNQAAISDEKSLLDPTNPYSATKTAAEYLVKSYYHSFKLPIIITRGNNVYGPQQYPEKVIPKFIYRLLSDLPCAIQGHGKQVRSFLYIDDVVSAFDIILNKGVIGEIYNIGCDDGTNECSILDLADKLVASLKPDVNPEDWITYVKDRDFNDQRYHISNEKIKSLGWIQQYPLNIGLSKTIEWYKNAVDYWPYAELLSVIGAAKT